MSGSDVSLTIGLVEACGLIGRWWFSYDEGDFDDLSSMLAEDVRFITRTDTGTSAIEEYVRCDVEGRDQVIAWLIDHRAWSPYPLRHCCSNLHLTGARKREVDVASYLFVTQIRDLVPDPISTAICSGTVRREEDRVRIARLEVRLDTMTSVEFRDRSATA